MTLVSEDAAVPQAASEPSRRLRIMRIADVRGDRLGGVSRAMIATSELLTDRGHAIELCFTEDMVTPGPQRCRRILVPLLIPLRVARMQAGGKAPDLIEVHEPLGAPYAVARKLRPQLPPIVTLSHGLEELGWRAQKARWRSLGQRGPLQSRLLVPTTLIAQAKVALRLADAVIVLSSQDREHLSTKRAMGSIPVHRIDNGVEEDLLALSRAPREDGTMLLLFIGAWTDRKGTPELAEAFALLQADHPSARLVVAGAGRSPRDVLAGFPAVVHSHVEVHETVTREELRDLLSRADVYVLPSWFEGMPLSLLEASAAGLPIVACDTCGIRDVVRPSDPAADGGCLVTQCDGAALHAALDRLVSDPVMRAELGARARARAGAFTWRRSADALEGVYFAAVEREESARQRRSSQTRPRAGPRASLAPVSREHVLHRPQLRWRRRHVFAVFGLRPAVAEHSKAEAALLQQHAAGARTIVELGVAEGGSALELREVMADDGLLVLVDPYTPGRLRISLVRLVSRRTVSRSSRGRVRWMRATSSQAATRWDGDIDFLFIDADHSLDAVTRDWEQWTPYVPVGGHVALHDARAEPAGWPGDRQWITDAAGPVVLTQRIRRDEAWELAGEAETTVVFRRAR